MTLVVVTPPAVLPVSLDEAKRHLRVDHGEDDNLISLQIAVATSTLDGPDATLGRSLLKQTLALKLPGFPCSSEGLDIFDRLRLRGESPYLDRFYSRHRHSFAEIPLPFPPVIGNLAITYTDQASAPQILDTALYKLIGGGSGISRVVPVFGQNWPSAQNSPESVSIQWDAGYGDTADKVPAPLRHAILLIVGHLYENRQSVVVDASRIAIQLPQGVEALISAYRVFV